MPPKKASLREGEGRTTAERMAREIIPKWANASAANTMEYENALQAQMMTALLSQHSHNTCLSTAAALALAKGTT